MSVVFEFIEGVVPFMKRFMEQVLYDWYNKKRRKPLIIRGARQVGKSTLVRQFAKNNGITLYEINLEKHLQLDSLFKSLDVDNIIAELNAFFKNDIKIGKSLLFLDEIQSTPHAIQALRYFYEELPDLPIIAAGSLLEFILSMHDFSMPVGRIEYLYLGPMTFKEFLLALNESHLLKVLDEFDLDKGIAQIDHENLLKRHREYLFIGGMPEVILNYTEDNNISKVVDTLRSINETYQDDFAKYAKRNELIRLQRIYNFVPKNIGKKVKYSNITREEQSREIKSGIDILEKARVILKICHSNCSGLPLKSEINLNIYKLLFLDVGLMNQLCGLNWISLKSINEISLINEGAIAEQFIGQHLLYKNKGLENPNLCYWLREQKISNAEVDYVISCGNLIIPVEVKSGKSGTLKSLQQFIFKKQLSLALRFDLNKPSLQNISHIVAHPNTSSKIEFTLLSLPLYMVEETTKIINFLL